MRTARTGTAIRLLLATAAAMALSSCVAVRFPSVAAGRPVVRLGASTRVDDPFLRPAAETVATTKVGSAAPASAQTVVRPQSADPVGWHATSAPSRASDEEDVAVVRIVSPPRPTTVVRAVGSSRPSATVRLTAAAGMGRLTSAGSTAVSDRATVFYPAEPRTPLGSEHAATATTSSGSVSRTGATGWVESSLRDGTPTVQAPALPEAALLYPDEYLFDGGDRGSPIHYGLYHRLGVETEDTIAEFVDDEGKRHVRATNRVAVYAPRFGSVRTVSVVGAGTGVEHLASARDLSRNASLSVQTAWSQYDKHLAAGNVRVRSRASGLQVQRTPANTAASLRLAQNQRLLYAFEDVAFVRTGEFDRANEARLSYYVAAAAEWTRRQYPVISASAGSLQEVYSRFKPEELVGLETKHKRKGDLRIVKLADKQVARPGDVITFTIRYDNLGDRELRNVRIVDNLTPRLQFLEDSATSDRPGTVNISDNGEGSVVLEFVLDDPLPGHEGGVITFQARVR